MIERRTTAGGAVRWDVTLRRPDRSRYKRTFLTKADAQKWEREELRKRDKGDWIDPTLGTELVRDVGLRWLTLPGRREKTIESHEYRLRLIDPGLGGRQIAQVRRADVQRLVHDLTIAGYSAHTVRGAYSTLHALFEFAVSEGLVGRSPCADINLPSIETKAGRALEPDELAALADAMDERYRAMIWCAGYFGLRIGEVIGLQRADIDLDGGWLSVRRTTTYTSGGTVIGPPKTAAGMRTLPLRGGMHSMLVEQLDALPDRRPTAWLFPGPRGGVLDYHNWTRRQWRAAVGLAGLDPLTPHDLRRTAATILINQGIDPVTVQHWMGHADVRTTLNLYARVRGVSMVEAADTLDDLFTWTHGEPIADGEVPGAEAS